MTVFFELFWKEIYTKKSYKVPKIITSINREFSTCLLVNDLFYQIVVGSYLNFWTNSRIF